MRSPRARDTRERIVPTLQSLTQLLGLSYAEAAQVCDCKVGTIRSRVSRARGDLMAMLDTEGTAGEVRPA